MQEQIWMTILDAERLTRYYARLAIINKRAQFWLNIIVTLCSLAAATVLLIDIHKAVPATLFFVVAASTAWGIFAEYAKKATLAATAAKECAKAKTDAVELWYDQYADDAMQRALTIARRLSDLTSIDIEEDERLNRKCAEEAYIEIGYEFQRA